MTKAWTPVQEGRFHYRNMGERTPEAWATHLFPGATAAELAEHAKRIRHRVALAKRADAKYRHKNNSPTVASHGRQLGRAK
jgi:hypothetical protein